ncbi:ABC-ATPase domain-containing protein [Clostridium sp. Marseille-P2415]|uniref:ABC-ATPase domain-containing protein n=1 Tax=Clostridium sp. Marseille-P2415 TaxID=1805471 RepID=UPI0009884630|nr:ABC-ATPase domain-containing protein [Clostridium sp. Marseille-P2415]
MKASEDLRQFLRSIDRKGYPAYKGAKGEYRFPDYVLSVDHVQGDPFASPSRVSIRVDGKRAGFPAASYDRYYKRIALEDYLLRRFGEKVEPFQFKAKGSGKSGLITVSCPGQEILERTACCIREADGSLLLRLEVGFPANGRTINSAELIKILFDFLPACVAETCFFGKYTVEEKIRVEEVRKLSEDQEEIRRQLAAMDLAAFVANGSILPRQSGVSKKPLKKAVPFQAPERMEVELSLPNRGKIKGMGIPKGVTLIVGGGYHGKSTLLKSLECGIYNHIAGDGRELVITDASAVKLRAEDGRSVREVDISLFIKNLPDKRDTIHFCTEDASGSTSQAAGVVEAMESGAHVFLVDEDTSATNFMIRDQLMQQVVNREKEPITPFIERVRGLYDQNGISTILVAGSSGAYFHVADHVIQMDSYLPKEITGLAKEAAGAYGEEVHSLPVSLVSLHRVPSGLHTGGKEERFRMKVLGRDSLKIGREVVDLRFVEQLADTEQIAALGYFLKYGASHLINGKRTLVQVVDELEKKVRDHGLASLEEDGYLPVDLALPRRQEIFAAFNRCRSLMF